MPTTGHCLCGSVTYSFEGQPGWTGYCHCESCRRNCSAPVTAFLTVAASGFRWTGATPERYASSKGVRRSFCAACGTPMAFEADHYPGEVHLYMASLSDPAAFHPAEHVHHEERLPWFDVADDLPRFEGFHGG
ncbi:GFA family protein [Roseovarius sp. SCSIO 43702]|uniref:GFA family protein n=1 Tax=Roseovarius sp. SCSIO 43702 TaxID=2823043 RepID=UPI001C738826|nr:GFA family protein [Roseovarius sp. SCSIO 43702]QYX55803.1 GFA family protein [Roseovarius sp. SCSIO 43702]